MKKSYYGNRGMPFEEFIKLSNEFQQRRGISVITKQATAFKPIRNNRGAVVSCKVEEKSTVDFIGRYGRFPVAIEAKHTETDSIRFDRVEPHQAAFMDAFVYDGKGMGIVLISFKMQRFFAVPWMYWRAGIDAAQKPAYSQSQKHDRPKVITIDTTDDISGQPLRWSTPGKASIRPEELRPEWEVFQSQGLGLDYLHHADRKQAVSDCLAEFD